MQERVVGNLTAILYSTSIIIMCSVTDSTSVFCILQTHCLILFRQVHARLSLRTGMVRLLTMQFFPMLAAPSTVQYSSTLPRPTDSLGGKGVKYHKDMPNTTMSCTVY